MEFFAGVMVGACLGFFLLAIISAGKSDSDDK
jgi:F0F1-type ATP synthase assembly protein I